MDAKGWIYRCDWQFFFGRGCFDQLFASIAKWTNVHPTFGFERFDDGIGHCYTMYTIHISQLDPLFLDEFGPKKAWFGLKNFWTTVKLIVNQHLNSDRLFSNVKNFIQPFFCGTGPQLILEPHKLWTKMTATSRTYQVWLIITHDIRFKPLFYIYMKKQVVYKCTSIE